MDMSKLSTGAKLVLGGTVAFLIVSIFNWQEIEFANVSAGVSMWHGWGLLAGLLALVLLAWEGSRLAGMDISLPISPAMTSAFLGLAIVLFTVLKFLFDGELRTFWAWLGLLFAFAIGAGAVMNMKAAGESFGDMKGAVTAGASAATAAAKSATDSASSSASSASSSATETVSDAAETVEHTAENAVDAVQDAVDGPDNRPAV